VVEPGLFDVLGLAAASSATILSAYEQPSEAERL